jgi:hypothetical protein
MFALISLIFVLVFQAMILPFRILGNLMRSSWFWGLVCLFGVLSLLGGIISGLIGLIKGVFPLLLVAAGIALIVYSNKKEPEAKEEAFDSFYANTRRSSQE